MLHSSWQSSCENCRLWHSLSPVSRDSKMPHLGANISLTLALVPGSAAPAWSSPQGRQICWNLCCDTCGWCSNEPDSPTLHFLGSSWMILIFSGCLVPRECYSLAAPGGQSRKQCRRRSCIKWCAVYHQVLYKLHLRVYCFLSYF